MAFTTLPLADSFGIIVEPATSNSPPLSEAIAPDQVVELFNYHSVVFFRGFQVSTDGFKQFTQQYGNEFMPYVSGAYNRQVIGGDNTLLSVTGHDANFGVPLHGEMYYKAQRPLLIWFYCAIPAESGGETTVCDGIAVYKALAPTTRTLLGQQQIKYVRTYPHDLWTKIYQTEDLDVVAAVCADNGLTLTVHDADRAITTEYLHPAVITDGPHPHPVFINNILPVLFQEETLKQSFSRVRLEDGSPLPAEVVADIRTTTARLTVPIPWEAGSLVMIDNTRMLHGRRGFEGNQRTVYARLCQPSFALVPCHTSKPPLGLGT